MRTANQGIRRTFGRTVPLRGMLAVALLAGLGACARDAVGPGRASPGGPSFTINPACDSALGGQVHTDSVLTAETWTRANSPHRVNAYIYIEGPGVLTLEPGTVLCFVNASWLSADHGGRLVAEGRDTARIVFTAADPANWWQGVRLFGSPGSASVLKHVRMEYASGALTSSGDHAAVIDSSVFRQNGYALSLFGRGSRISRSRVDTTTTPWATAAATIGTQVTFEQNVIRGAAGVGLAVMGIHGVSLLGGRIEGSGGVGLRVTTTGAGFVSTAPVRVVGGASYPAELVVSAFPRIYTTVAQQDSLLGNARDTLVVTGGLLQQFAYPTQALPWHVVGDIQVQNIGILAPKPGATLVFDEDVGIHADYGGRVVARGTATAPVLFTAADAAAGWDGVWLYGTPALSSYLTNVRMEHTTRTAVHAFDGHVLAIDSAVFRQNGAAAVLYAANSRISRSRVDTTTWSARPAVQLGYNTTLESTLIRGSAWYGLVVDRAAVLSCDIRDSASHGISGTVNDVHNCNLVNNAGSGISNNPNWSLANAEDNWWGDAAGPTGASGDGVSGPVDYTPWRTTPYVLPYVP
ncbi:MAG TPA: right-handed parallel beta-helix repeat-containing protein [Longimicrobium sp.]|nr:right-handed parallel beta-helix repeat-containing protein [Longimicrobium sp.]